jgi:hypothetical protein
MEIKMAENIARMMGKKKYIQIFGLRALLKEEALRKSK